MKYLCISCIYRTKIMNLFFYFNIELRSNFLGTEFTIYDNGKKSTKTNDLNNLRKELGVVLYVINFY